jgi:hypothetical protein
MKSQLFGILLVLACAGAIFALVRNRQTTRVDLNSGMTAAIASPPAGFVSTRTFPPSEVPARIAAIRWFEHCGEPFQGKLSMPFEQVRSWAEAEQRSAEGAWETATLEAQNQLTLWLHLHAQQRYQNWNRLVETHNATTIDPVVARSLAPFRQTHNLSKEFIGCATWDLRGALMEDSYRDTGHAVFFFHELLEVYEAGHYPCGWVGQWPEGKLLIY